MGAAASVSGEVQAPAESRRKVSYTRTMRRLVQGKNISEKSLLATDYLNHFNEVIMMIEMIPMMPECLNDIKGWQPKSYAEHFRDSCFSDKDLAILAYDHAPPEYRIPFDETIRHLDGLVLDLVGGIEKLIASDQPDVLQELVDRTTKELRDLIDKASAIIHGKHFEAAEAVEVTEVVEESAEEDEVEAAETASQADIDALFD